MLAAMVTQNPDRRARDLVIVALAYAAALVVAMAWDGPCVTSTPF